MWYKGTIQSYNETILYGVVYKGDSWIKYSFNFPYNFLSNKQKKILAELERGYSESEEKVGFKPSFRLMPNILYNPKRRKIKFIEDTILTEEEIKEAMDRAKKWYDKLKFD